SATLIRPSLANSSRICRSIWSKVSYVTVFMGANPAICTNDNASRCQTPPDQAKRLLIIWHCVFGHLVIQKHGVIPAKAGSQPEIPPRSAQAQSSRDGFRPSPE